MPKVERGEMVVVNVKLPVALVRELDHLKVDLGLGLKGRSALVARIIRYGIDHQEEVLTDWQP